MKSLRPHAGITLVALTWLSLTSCAYDSEKPPETKPIDLAAEAQNLSGVCPDNIGIQLQWQPQADMGALFTMLGPGYQVDETDKSVSGPLVAGGKDTGVNITLKSGGPAIGFQSVASQLYVDDTVMLGVVHGDQLVAAASSQPVVGVTPTLKYSPSILMWDPSTHSDWKSLADIGKSGASVVVSKDQIFPQWMAARGLLDLAQIDTSFDGGPSRFVADPTIVQQGFANSDPYLYENVLPAWGKPVSYELIKDVGYDIYASNMSVRADKLTEYSPCLDKLVPIIQQAGVDYVASPDATNKVIVDVISRDQTYSPYTIGEASFSADLLRDKGLLANEDNGSFGVYDEARTNSSVAELTKILAATGNTVPSTATSQQLFTNEFTDPSISIP